MVNKKLKPNERKRVAEMVAEFREYVHEHGGISKKNMKRVWDVSLDDDADGEVGVTELLDALMDLGLDVTKQDSTLLRDFLDEDGSGLVSFEEFYTKTQKPLTKLRGRMLMKVWKTIDTMNDAQVPLSKVKALCTRMNQHYYVVEREEKAEQVLKEMLSELSPDKKYVTKKNWLKYWKSVSSDIPGDDDFGIFFSKMWDISFIPSYSLKKAQKFIKQSIVGSDLTNDEANEKIVSAFRQYDLNGDGVLEFSEFVAVLADLGVRLVEREARALFDHYDADGGGTIDFPEFAGGIQSYQVRKKTSYF